MSDAQLVEYCRAIHAREGLAGLTYASLKAHGTLYMTLYKRGIPISVLVDRLGIAGDRNQFHLMTDDELLGTCRTLYDQHGISALSYASLRSYRTLYTTLYHRGLRQSILLEKLGLAAEYAAWKAVEPVKHGSEIRQRWTWARVVHEARRIKAAQGFLPPAAWLQANGQASLVQAAYQVGRTWEEVRSELGDFETSKFVQSRNGMRWLSHAEASLSNFLYARGVEHRRGERYPEAYETLSGRSYGLFDMHFNGRLGPVDIEIWGDKPHGHDALRYQAKREQKEFFNASNPGFLGVHFSDCYSDDRLTALLEPHIGVIEPFQFDEPTDSFIQSTHWSNADELLGFCRQLAADQPNGEFPTEEWLRKRGKWADRPGPPYNTVSVYIKLWLGGMRKLRELLGQAHVSTNQWDQAKVLARWKAFREAHGITPNAMRARSLRGQAQYPADVLVEAALLVSVVAKYAGGSAAADLATGFTPNRRKAVRRAAQ